MSFIVSPSIFSGAVATTFGGDPIRLMTPFFVGREADEGLFAFLPKGGEQYTISSLTAHTIKIRTGAESFVLLDRQASEINGFPWFKKADGVLGRQVYYTIAHGWVLVSTNVFPGYIPNEFYNLDDDVWEGDDFYSSLRIPVPASTGSAVFVARGTNQNAYPAPTYDVEFHWPRYVGGSYNAYTGEVGPYGEYNAVAGSGVSGKKTLGTPSWRDNATSTVYTRSLYRSYGNFTYGEIRYDDANETWVIGIVRSPSGWYEGTEPSTSGGLFTFTKIEGSEVEGENITLVFNGYAMGDEKEVVFVGETGVLR